jgi:hypothetical protein
MYTCSKPVAWLLFIQRALAHLPIIVNSRCCLYHQLGVQVLFTEDSFPGEVACQLEAGVCFRTSTHVGVIAEAVAARGLLHLVDRKAVARTTSCEVSGQGVAGVDVPTSTPAGVVSSHDKAWMIANIARQYL